MDSAGCLPPLQLLLEGSDLVLAGDVVRVQQKETLPGGHRLLSEYFQTSGFKNRSLDLTLSDYPAGNLEYVQTTPAGHILFIC